MISILEGISQRLQKGGEVDLEHLKQLAEFISVFMEKCHHKKEEGYLFPAMQGAGIPDPELIKNLLQDHLGFYKLIGDIVTTFSRYDPVNPKTAFAVVEVIGKYTPSLKEHAEKEEDVAFPAADKYLSVDVQEKLFHDFEEFERRQIGEGKHEQFHRMLDELTKIYLS